ncbi:MAG: hypothetical protein ABSG03_33365 [Bryobacteraceae bacterium]|jgi:hypothetical protein
MQRTDRRDRRTLLKVNHAYADGWLVIHPDKVSVGCALKTQWVPGRSDIERVIEEQAKKDG